MSGPGEGSPGDAGRREAVVVATRNPHKLEELAEILPARRLLPHYLPDANPRIVLMLAVAAISVPFALIVKVFALTAQP